MISNKNARYVHKKPNQGGSPIAEVATLSAVELLYRFHTTELRNARHTTSKFKFTATLLL